MNALALEHVSKSYFLEGVERPVLKDINLQVEHNEIVAIVGASGCGKSTLLRLVVGLDADYRGTISWGNPEDASNAKVGMVFQDHRLYPWLTVQGNVDLAFDNTRLSPAERRERTTHYLRLVGLADYAKAYPRQLSGGMAQRAAIARALAQEPDVRLVGAVGNDAFATTALSLLDEAKIDLSAVKRVQDATGIAMISVTDDGENSIIVVPGANGKLTAKDAGTTVAGMYENDVLVLQLEVPSEVVETALIAARSKRITTVLNTAPLVKNAQDVARLADVVVANETEFQLLAGGSVILAGEHEQILREIHRRSQQTFIVTLGKNGAIAIDKGQVFKVSGLLVTAVDTVGAGDTFCGYLAAGLAAAIPFPQALRRAAVAGSLACLKPGAQTAIPTLSEVQQYI